jgi:hypothetical protein
MNADAAIKYQTRIDLAQRNSSHTLLHELAVRVGHGTWRSSKWVCRPATWWPRSPPRAIASTASTRPRVRRGRLARPRRGLAGGLDESLAAHPEARFDVLVFGDVLEHMLDPCRGPAPFACALRPGGSVVISLPHIAHWQRARHAARGPPSTTPTAAIPRRAPTCVFFTRERHRAPARRCGACALERLQEVVQTSTRWAANTTWGCRAN